MFNSITDICTQLQIFVLKLKISRFQLQISVIKNRYLYLNKNIYKCILNVKTACHTLNRLDDKLTALEWKLTCRLLAQFPLSVTIETPDAGAILNARVMHVAVQSEWN